MAVASSMLAGSGCTRIGPGHVGIEVDLAGSQRGVQDFTLKTGWVFYNPISTEIEEYPTFVQTVAWTKSLEEGNPVNEEITFTTGDQMKVDADISLAYHLVAEKVPAFYVKFRSDDLQTFTHGFLRNMAREKFDNIAGKYKIEDIMGDNAKFLADTRKALQEELEPQGVILDQFGFIGAPRPPQAVVDAINEKVRAIQQAIMAENQLRTSRAEAQKRIAAAEGEAESNKILTSSLSPTLLEWRRLELQGQAIVKWNGNLPTYNGGGAIPFLQLPQK
ncbi:MAG: prohibitin family protein [Candidatus Yanofskybacteria bacterium]|nr:prohibitin family protein [Candidatus Yanofskybacteria bacterium]